MKKVLIHVLQYLVFIGLAVLLLYLSFRSLDFSVLLEKIKTAQYGYILTALLVGFTSLYIRAYRWNIIIEPLGFSPSIHNTFHALSIGYMSNYAFPRLGEVTRCGILNRTEKIPADVLIGTVIAERLFDMLTLLILTITVILIRIQFFGNFFSEKICHPIVSKLLILFSHFYIVAFVFVGFMLLLVVSVFVFREHILKITLVKKVGRIAKGIIAGMKIIFEIKRKKGFIASTILLWFTYLLITYLIFLSLAPTSKLTLLDALFVLVAGSYGMAAPVQAGIGAFHGIVALSLSIYSISWADGIAYAILNHGSQSIGLIIIGCTSLIILFMKRKKVKSQTEN